MTNWRSLLALAGLTSVALLLFLKQENVLATFQPHGLHVEATKAAITTTINTPVSSSTEIATGFHRAEILGIETSCECLQASPRPPFTISPFSSQTVDFQIPEGFDHAPASFEFKVSIITSEASYPYVLTVDVE